MLVSRGRLRGRHARHSSGILCRTVLVGRSVLYLHRDDSQLPRIHWKQ